MATVANTNGSSYIKYFISVILVGATTLSGAISFLYVETLKTQKEFIVVQTKLDILEADHKKECHERTEIEKRLDQLESGKHETKLFNNSWISKRI